MVARPQDGQQGSRNGSHTAGSDNRSLRVFQRSQFPVEQLVVGGIIQPDISNVMIARLVLVLEVCGLKNGRGDCPADARLWLPGVYQSGLDRLVGVGHLAPQ